MQPQVETAPVAAPSRRRFPGWQAAAVLVLAVLAGAAIMLQVRGWPALESESGRACGTAPGGCPRPAVPALIISFAVGLAAVPALIRAAAARGPKVGAGLAATGLAAGVFAGQAMSGVTNGPDLRVDWAAPYDGQRPAATEGVWTTGGSLIQVRADRVVSYQEGTGRRQWTLAVPAGNAACALSAAAATPAGQPAAGLVGYGAGGACDHVLAVDLATGRELWSRPVAAGWQGAQGTGFLAVGGDTALAVTPGAVLGYDLGTGAPRWTAATPPGCSDQTAAAARQSVVVLAACGQSFDVIGLDPASGRQLWRTPVPAPAPGYQFAVLSADPAVVHAAPAGQAGRLLAFGADGRVASSIPAAGLDLSDYAGFGPEVAVSGGLLAAVTRPGGGRSAVVAFRLADGRKQWQVAMPDDVLSLRQDGGRLLVVGQSAPSLTLEAITVASGAAQRIGSVPGNVVDRGGAALYPAGGRYVVVNLTGRAHVPPLAAVG